MTQPQKPHAQDLYHPNQVDLHMEDVRQEALQSLGLKEEHDLSAEQAAQVGQAMADRVEALKSNVNQLSE